MFGLSYPVYYSVCLKGPQFKFRTEHATFFEASDRYLAPENLHSHEYRARITIEGPPDKTGRVVDFTALEKAFKEVLDAWDGRVILHKKYELDPALRRQYKKQKRLYLEKNNPTSELIAGMILDDLVDLLERRKTVPKSSLDDYSYTLRLIEKPGHFAVEASMGGRFDS